AVNVSAGSLIDGRPDAYSTSPGVTLSGGRISVANLSPGNLTMSGGTLSAFGNVVVNGTLDWTGGTMGAGGTQAGSGQWVHDGSMPGSGQLIIGALDGAVHNEVLDGTTLTNNNNTSNSFLYSQVADQGGSFQQLHGSVFNNQSQCTFLIRGALTWNSDGT